ncbi:MAG: hypothetical protein AAB672_01000 [Patescibacteria group bacterium]
MAKDNRSRITELQKALNILEERLSSLQKLTDTTDSRFQVIQERRTEATRLKNEINVLKQQAENVITEMEQKNTIAGKLEDSIQGLVNNAEESKETFEIHSKLLQEIEEKIKKFEIEITDQLGRAGSGALAKSFSVRQEEIEKELKKWFLILAGTTSGLVLVSITFFIYSFFVQLNLQFFLKLTISLPFIYTEWFATKQYNKERFILERYVFKAAQAKSLSAFSKTVNEMDESDNGKSNTQQFVISSIEKIYIAPKLDSSDEEFPIFKIAEKVTDAVKEGIKSKLL